jgi:hypothetical protein
MVGTTKLSSADTNGVNYKVFILADANGGNYKIIIS